MHFHYRIRVLLILWCFSLSLCSLAQEIVIENDVLRYAVGTNGENLSLCRKGHPENLLATPSWSCATIRKGDHVYPASRILSEKNQWRISFGDSGTEVTLRLHAQKTFLTFEVLAVKGNVIDSLTFLNLPIQEKASFAVCTLALNLKTNVPELPGPMHQINAIACNRFGLEGAKAALLVAPPESLRDMMKTVVQSSDAIPHSLLGGPWAMEAPIARGSYLIDMDGKLGEESVDAWIRLANEMGITQIDFHTGKTMRFGDLAPNPHAYPHGFDGVKTVVDKLHAAGIKAGLHTYAFFMAKDAEWVSPKPDPRLAKAHLFHLAQDVTAETDQIPLTESPEGITATTGFQVRNSATIQIDDELITFENVTSGAPFAFTGCKRGAWGTTPARHTRNAQVAHLKECFGLFAPDGDSALFAEVAARTAEVYNRCGFDMIYLDALDGVDLIAGWENSWHYAGKFVFEINKRLKRPALFEMSMFNHHLWYTRSRMGAWDVPARAFKQYVDLHAMVNEDCARMFMPAHLGWWGAFEWAPVQPERTFSDDIEYLCAKNIGHDASLSFFVGFTPENWAQSSNIRRLGHIIRQYESLRLSASLPESIKAALRVRGDEFELIEDTTKKPVFRRTFNAKHLVAGNDTASWTVRNRFSPQEPRIRIEALISADPYDSPDAIALSDLAHPGEFTEKSTQTGVITTWNPVTQPVRDNLPCMAFEAKSQHPDPASAWSMAGKTFPALLNLENRALGVWIHGDGQGELLNIQLKNPPHINNAFSDHYLPIDFTGWRYCLLVEPESDRIGQYGWPYSDRQDFNTAKPMALNQVFLDYNLWVDYGHISSLNILLNNLPPGQNVRCVMTPVRALPLKPIEVIHPQITVGGKTMTFPITLKSGQYLEYRPQTDCVYYDAKGEPLGTIVPQGERLTLEAGNNPVRFSSQAAPNGLPIRARVTISGTGALLTPH